MGEIFEEIFSFASPLHVFLFVDLLLVILILVVALVKYCNKLNNTEDEVQDPTPVVAETPLAVEEPAPVVESAPVVVEEPVPVVEDVTSDEEVAIGDLDDLEAAKRIPFKDKMLSSMDNVKGYYNEIENKFISFRKINSRVSIKGVSYRLGRKLVAKLTIRGKTLKMHLALDVKDFEQNVFFQKDMSDVKEYAEVPFTVKIRSDRALKNALKLIDALAEKQGFEKKTRFTEVDAIAELAKED